MIGENQFLSCYPAILAILLFWGDLLARAVSLNRVIRFRRVAASERDEALPRHCGDLQKNGNRAEPNLGVGATGADSKPFSESLIRRANRLKIHCKSKGALGLTSRAARTVFLEQNQHFVHKTTHNVLGGRFRKHEPFAAPPLFVVASIHDRICCTVT